MTHTSQSSGSPGHSVMTGVVERNIRALLERRERDERSLGWDELAQDVEPERVLDTMEKHEEANKSSR